MEQKRVDSQVFGRNPELVPYFKDDQLQFLGRYEKNKVHRVF